MFALTKNSFFAGMIIAFKGAIADIPAGWHLCDGTNGTDDLRDKMVIGAGNTYVVDDTGGYVSHNHTFTGVAHEHEVPQGDSIAAGADYDDMTGSDIATGTIDTKSHLPPYVSKGWIQKL